MQMNYQGETYHQDQTRVSRVRVTKTDDSGNQQKLEYQGVAGEQHTEVLRVQAFGLSNHAPPNSEAVMLTMANRDMPVILGVESPSHKPTNLPEGGTRVYDSNGSYVDLDAGGNITAVSATKITLTTGELEINANVTINGNITQNGNFDQSGVHTDSNGPHTA